MNIEKFDEIMDGINPIRFGQQPLEWQTFMEFVTSYFNSRGIDNPIVVEIGIWTDHQREFYCKLLNAEYIGMDMSDIEGEPEILGDSHSTEVYQELVDRLKGRQIDLLFIDASHNYEGVKQDYTMYAPLTKHIVALHDIGTLPLPTDTEPVEVINFWKEIEENNKVDTLLTIRHWNPVGSGQFNDLEGVSRQMNIGIVVKQGGSDDK